MFLVLLAAACLIVLLFGVALCRMAARSDAWNAGAPVVRTIAYDDFESADEDADGAVEQLPYEPPRRAYRATG